MTLLMLGVLLAAMSGGCGSAPRSYYAESFFGESVGSGKVRTIEAGEKRLPVFAGSTGRSLSASDLQSGFAWADVIFIGETHDDAVGHAAQTAIAKMLAYPGSPWRLSMEMLERDDQAAADEFFAGRITKEEFIERTKSADWAGKGSWVKFYQPTIDAMAANGPPLIAANSPRGYVRMGRKDGYQAMRALPAEERELFALPRKTSHGGYERRFIEWSTMSDEGSPHGAATLKQARSGLKSQLVWDATMADSIAMVMKRDGVKVMHLVGQFHSDFEGGTVQELRARMPGVKVLTVSLRPTDSKVLMGADWGRADIVIYTGEPEEK
jgi:uncharacterized iron-regulated protein